MKKHVMTPVTVLAITASGCATAGTTSQKAASLPVCESNVIAVVPSQYWTFDEAVKMLKDVEWATDADTLVKASNKPVARASPAAGFAYSGSRPLPMLRGEARILSALDENGSTVKTLMVRTSGSTDLDEAARRSIESAQFHPVVYNGCRAQAVMMVPVSYRGATVRSAVRR